MNQKTNPNSERKMNQVISKKGLNETHYDDPVNLPLPWKLEDPIVPLLLYAPH
jgi:hypothetical protein